MFKCAPNISSVVKIAVSQNVAQAEAEGWLVDENASGNFELSKGLSRCVIRSVPDRIKLPRDKLAARKAG